PQLRHRRGAHHPRSSGRRTSGPAGRCSRSSPGRTRPMSDDLTRAIMEATEGKGRAGTARWPECCRDTYSLAIEEIAAALTPLIEARVREAQGPCTCPPWHPDMDGPEEDCAQHG